MPETCLSIMSKTDKGHVLFFDYDTKKVNWVIEKLLFIQNWFGLSNIYLFIHTKSGYYSAACFDIVDYELAKSIHREADDDKNYQDTPEHSPEKCWGFRVTSKENDEVKLGQIMPSTENERPQSLAHIAVFRSLFKGIRPPTKKAKNYGFGLYIYNTKPRS